MDLSSQYLETIGVRTLYANQKQIARVFMKIEAHNRRHSKKKGKSGDGGGKASAKQIGKKQRRRHALRRVYVENAGGVKANGEYIYVGHQNGAPCYMKGEWKLSREVFIESVGWVIGRIPAAYDGGPHSVGWVGLWV